MSYKIPLPTKQPEWISITNEKQMQDGVFCSESVCFWVFLSLKCFYFPRNYTVPSLPAPPDTSSLKRELHTKNKHSNEEGSTVRNNHSVQISKKKASSFILNQHTMTFSSLIIQGKQSSHCHILVTFTMVMHNTIRSFPGCRLQVSLHADRHSAHKLHFPISYQSLSS